MERGGHSLPGWKALTGSRCQYVQGAIFVCGVLQPTFADVDNGRMLCDGDCQRYRGD